MKRISFLIIGLLISTMIFTSCEQSLFYITGKGEIVEQEFSLPDFDAVHNNEAIDVFINYGETQKVLVEGHQNIIDRLKLNIHDKTWDIDLFRGRYKNYTLNVYITIPYLREAELNGSGNIEIGAFENLDNLKLEINGSGNIVSTENITTESLDCEVNGSGHYDLLINTNTINSNITGSGNINLYGSAINQDIDICGSGSVLAFDFESENVKVDIDGSGNTEINVSNNLDVEIRGSGDVLYKGFPTTKVNISGSGNVISKN